MNRKVKICRNFNKAVHTYDQNCSIQNQICDSLINILLKYQKDFNVICDVACGTGESTQRLTQAVHYQQCYAMDLAENLLNSAKQKLINNTRVSFVRNDLDNGVFKKSCFDLIFSNMGLQWSSNFQKAIKLFHHYLFPKKILAFSIPIEGNFPEMKKSFKLQLLNHNIIAQILYQEKFKFLEYEIKKIPVNFREPFDILKYLKNLGINNNLINKYNNIEYNIKIDEIFNVPENTQLTYHVGIYLIEKI